MHRGNSWWHIDGREYAPVFSFFEILKTIFFWYTRNRVFESIFMSEAVVAQAEESIDARESRRSRWFFILFFGAILLSVAATFYRTFIARDYLILMETVCDPSASVCFARDICDTEEGICVEGSVPVETVYYKLVERKAFAFPEVCATGSLEAEECIDLSCRPDEAECSETLCFEEIVPEGETCRGPDAMAEGDTVKGIGAESGGSLEENAPVEMIGDPTLPIEDNASGSALDGDVRQGTEGGEGMTEEAAL